jgi:DNA-binding transcriptional LysR family regulator
MDVNLRQIRAFVTVAQLRSFTAAAAMLHIAQPTLTVQIKRLEEALALRLLDRNSRSVGLTRIGRDLLPVFQRMLADLDSVVVDARDLSSQRRGTVRIACLPSIAAGLLPDAIEGCPMRSELSARHARESVSSSRMPSPAAF